MAPSPFLGLYTGKMSGRRFSDEETEYYRKKEEEKRCQKDEEAKINNQRIKTRTYNFGWITTFFRAFKVLQSKLVTIKRLKFILSPDCPLNSWIDSLSKEGFIIKDDAKPTYQRAGKELLFVEDQVVRDTVLAIEILISEGLKPFEYQIQKKSGLSPVLNRKGIKEGVKKGYLKKRELTGEIKLTEKGEKFMRRIN